MPQSIVLDVRKLLCPLPVIRLQQTIQQHENEAHIIVLATDPGVLYDIPAWCRIHGHSILHTEQTKQEIRIEISVNKNPLRQILLRFKYPYEIFTKGCLQIFLLTAILNQCEQK